MFIFCNFIFIYYTLFSEAGLLRTYICKACQFVDMYPSFILNQAINLIDIIVKNSFEKIEIT